MDLHEKNRNLVCILCLSKTSSLRPISDTASAVIRQLLQDFDSKRNLYPSVICGTCRVACGEFSKGGSRVPKIHNYKPENSTITRSQGICKCEICVAASTREGRSNLPGFVSKNLKRGRPRSSPDTESIGGCKTFCETCYSEYGRGKRHRCTSFARASNLKTMLKAGAGESSSSSSDAAVADYLRSKPVTPGKMILVLIIPYS